VNASGQQPLNDLSLTNLFFNARLGCMRISSRLAAGFARSLTIGALIVSSRAAAQLPSGRVASGELAAGGALGILSGLAGLEIGYRLDQAGWTPRGREIHAGAIVATATFAVVGTSVGVDRVAAWQHVPSQFGKASVGASAGLVAMELLLPKHRDDWRRRVPWFVPLLLPSIGATITYNLKRR